MLEFKARPEPHSFDMRRDGYRIGYLQCNPAFEPRIIIEDTDRLSLAELRQILAKAEESNAAPPAAA
jgi:hypothetical protein